MPRITKVYTRTGDEGLTSLGDGERVAKTAVRIEAYGTVDELNAAIGIALASDPAEAVIGPLRRIQNELFHVGADLCIPDQHKQNHPGPRIEPRHIEALEQLMDQLTEQLPPLENFVLPGGTLAAAQLHVARTICRRAERDTLRLAALEPLSADLLRYMNRLSDVLFVLARYENLTRGQPDITWDSRA